MSARGCRMCSLLEETFRQYKILLRLSFTALYHNSLKGNLKVQNCWINLKVWIKLLKTDIRCLFCCQPVMSSTTSVVDDITGQQQKENTKMCAFDYITSS